MIIRFAAAPEYPEVLKFYQECYYNGGIEDEDTVVIAIDQQIIGAVRICQEQGLTILRGMQIKSQWHRLGLGRSMLDYLADNVTMDNCYCLPYSHLKDFYGLIGFKEIAADTAPPFIAERLENYRDKGLDVIIMNKK